LSTVTVHWVRHGKIASHRGNVPLTDEGMSQAQERGRDLARDLSPGEVVHFLHAPTLRTRQTVEEIRTSMAEALGPDMGVDLLKAREHRAVRNPDLYVAGQRVEMVSSAEALAEQLSDPPVSSETLSKHPFFGEFFVSPDRIGLWIGHPDPPGEDPVAVARRQMTFATSLAYAREDRPIRYVLSTHSPVLRAIVLCYLGEDPGEPKYLEPIDLTSSTEGSWDLRFRGQRKRLAGTKVDGGSPR